MRNKVKSKSLLKINKKEITINISKFYHEHIVPNEFISPDGEYVFYSDDGHIIFNGKFVLELSKKLAK